MSDIRTPVDWHVHVHQPGKTSAVLDSAAAAFARVNPRRDGPLGVLMLAEMPGQSVFDDLRVPGDSLGPWSISSTDEAVSVVASRGEERVVVIAGYQITTAERLEVLALGTRARPKDGLPAERLLKELTDHGVMAVLPWGVGKWLGARGAIVSELVQRLPPQAFSLGDNAGRPRFWPLPTPFRAAGRRGIAVLPGTDTLPGAPPAAGGFGSLVPGPLSLKRPAEALRRVLAGPSHALTPYGSLSGPATFVRDQAMLRLRRLARDRGSRDGR
jgi:hypothetical protein